MGAENQRVMGRLCRIMKMECFRESLSVSELRVQVQLNV